MANNFYAISDGTYTLQESDNPNQFYFYRNDGKVLTDIDREPMDLYHAYIMNKMMNGEITDMVMNNIYSQMSSDHTTIRLTISDIGEDPVPRESSASHEKPSFWKRLFKKIFG